MRLDGQVAEKRVIRLRDALPASMFEGTELVFFHGRPLSASSHFRYRTLASEVNDQSRPTAARPPGDSLHTEMSTRCYGQHGDITEAIAVGGFWVNTRCARTWDKLFKLAANGPTLIRKGIRFAIR